MNLVVIHYHLNRGGVTSVIRNQIHALAGNSPITNVLVLHGPGVEGWPDRLDESELHRKLDRFEFREVPEIGYRENQAVDDRLFTIIKQSIEESGFDPDETLIQVHNHNLGKNNSLMATLPRLVQDLGFRLLLQIHDFAEDMRPGNFAAIREFCRHNRLESTDLVFPAHPRIHFAFLNRRDFDLVSETYAGSDRCHLLPNPVLTQPLESDPLVESSNDLDQARQILDCDPADRLIVYPVRAIRRKNVAEAMLLAASGQNLKVAVTLPAVSEDEVVQYRNMTRTADRLGLPIVFEAGQREIEFSNLISAADFVFTSSIAEGFGMVFLESWCWGKHLIGRNLSSITQDFTDEGLNLGGLYEELKIPLSWIDFESERANQQTLLEQVLQQFDVRSESTIRFEQEKSQGWIDFAKLCHRSQLSIVEKVWKNRVYQQTLLDANPLFQLPDFEPKLVEHNAKIVDQRFTVAPFRKRFLAAFESIFESKLEQSANTLERPSQEFLVKSFLDPQNFYPLRVERE